MRDFDEQMAKAEQALKEAMDAKAALKKEADWRRRNEVKILRGFKAKIVAAGYLSEQDVHEVYEDVVDELRAGAQGSAAGVGDTIPGVVSEGGREAAGSGVGGTTLEVVSEGGAADVVDDDA